MNRAFSLAGKDLKLLLRDKSSLFWVLIFPLMIAVLFGFVFGGANGASAIKIGLVDQDGTPESKALATRIRASSAVSAKDMSLEEGREAVRKSDLSAFVLIPKGFGEADRRFQYSQAAPIEVGIDPSRKAETGILQGVVSEAAYGGMKDKFAATSGNASAIHKRIAELESAKGADPANRTETLRFLKELEHFMGTGATSSSAGFNFEGPKIKADPIAPNGAQPASSFEVTFPQALIWGLLGVISTFAISLVKERERGTLVRLRVSPMSFGEILAGKAMACFGACAGIMLLLLLFGHFVFHIRLASPALLAMAIFSGAFCVVGIMMLLSVLGRTEQAVSGSAWGVMITMAMFGGGMIPVFMMPGWMQSASNLSPLKWTVLSIEGAIWRGFTFREMMIPCAVLVGIGVVAFAAGVQVLKRRG
jgi:ABC-2 type transport system permease protein